MGPPERERRPGKGGAESRGGRNQRQRSSDVPNEPPEDHHDDGWWAQLVNEVESGLIAEADR